MQHLLNKPSKKIPALQEVSNTILRLHVEELNKTISENTLNWIHYDWRGLPRPGTQVNVQDPKPTKIKVPVKAPRKIMNRDWRKFS